VARHAFLLRLDPALHDSLQRWAADDLRSLNGQIEFLLRHAVQQAGRLKQGSGEATEEQGKNKKERGAEG
jgi:hypothetical protein